MATFASLTLTFALLLTFDLGGVKAVRVITPLGPVEGIVSENSENFLGIKFATADRFAYPVPVTPWKEVYNATKVGPMCAQRCPSLPPRMCQPEMSEDCLYLNVFRPARKSSDLLPVVLFLHGGNFAEYSGGASLFHGDVIAAFADIIVVTINYRLGAFGWLGFVNETGEVTAANFGLEDQRAAMKWVRSNIASFGGDPGKVTLWGQSSGCQSAGLHLISSKSRGLFHRAILQSCPFILPFRTPQEALEQNLKLTLALNCSQGDITCLRFVSSEAVIDASKNVTLSSEKKNLLMKFQVWGPVMDSNDVRNRFLRDALNSTAVDVPVILGTTSDEGDVFIMDKSMPYIPGFVYNLILKGQWPSHYEKILKLYPSASELEDARPALTKLANDAVFYCPTSAVGRAMSGKGGRAWRYEFHQPLSFDGFGDERGMCLNKSCHGGDLPFMFGPAPSNGINVTLDDQLLSRLLIGYWGDFAHHGNPDGGVVTLTSWPNLTYQDPNGRRLHFLFQSRSFGTIPEARLEVCELLNSLPLP